MDEHVSDGRVSVPCVPPSAKVTLAAPEPVPARTEPPRVIVAGESGAASPPPRFSDFGDGRARVMGERIDVQTLRQAT